MKVLRAIGGFFAKIGRWIKETAWIQPLLIVGAIFAIIFAIPHIIDGVKGLFNESDSANKYFKKHEISLVKADQIDDGKHVGNSKVDELFTWFEEDKADDVKSAYGERFYLAFVEKDSASCKDLYGGVKEFQEKWKKNNAEFQGLKGEFKFYTIYVDTVSEDDDSINLFDEVWNNHYDLFETLGDTNYLSNTVYAQNKNYDGKKYESTFIGSETAKKSPINAPLLMYFDFSGDNKVENQKVKGLSDVVFSVEGSSDLEKARTLKRCWSHAEEFAEIQKK